MEFLHNNWSIIHAGTKQTTVLWLNCQIAKMECLASYMPVDKYLFKTKSMPKRHEQFPEHYFGHKISVTSTSILFFSESFPKYSQLFYRLQRSSANYGLGQKSLGVEFSKYTDVTYLPDINPSQRSHGIRRRSRVFQCYNLRPWTFDSAIRRASHKAVP